jgi:hypothetical protein
VFTAIHASHTGNLYQVTIHTVADIADLVRETYLETLTSSDGETDF